MYASDGGISAYAEGHLEDRNAFEAPPPDSAVRVYAARSRELQAARDRERAATGSLAPITVSDPSSPEEPSADLPCSCLWQLLCAAEAQKTT